MPYPMVHLAVGMDLIGDGIEVGSVSDFLLGAVAPDAVHYRAGAYSSDMKRDSHLCPRDEKWGYVVKNDEWLGYIKDFIRVNLFSPRRDFCLGYAAHILTDLQNNVTIWTPFRESLGGTFDKETYKLYGDECRAFDYELYCENADAPEIFRLLARSVPAEVPGLVSLAEVSALKRSVLYEKFASKTRTDISRHKYATRDVMYGFISGAETFAGDILKETINA